VERAIRTTARPFSVREADGRDTLVEPGAAPYVDRRATTEDTAAVIDRPSMRTRSFHLKAGAGVFVYGRVAERSAAPSGGDGYRDASRTTALQTPEDGALEVHAESPVLALRKTLERARFWRLLGPVLLALTEAAAFSDYLAQVTAGRVIDATVTSVSSSVEHGWSGGRYDRHRTTSIVRVVCAEPNARAESMRGGHVCSQVAKDDVAGFQQGAPVRLLTVDGWNDANTVGEHGSLHWIAAIVGMSAFLVLLGSAPSNAAPPWRARRAR